MLTSAGSVMAAMWGAAITFSSSKKGKSAGGGSFSKTSSAAPAMLFSLRPKQGRLVDDSPAGCVDQKGCLLHQGQLRLAHEVVRLLHV
ncbi:MAG: hypothetical protein QM256_00195 [Pseudomonadota bacterium]|nr:hypothetical protein [Pseudomonadota bacterium]